MNKMAALVFIFICLLSLGAVRETKSQSSATIYISADGSIQGTDKIQRVGNFYSLTDDIYDAPIIVECNNIIIDGAGFTLQGANREGDPPAVNLTCSHVTVRNLRVVQWEVGVLGAYNDNVIQDSYFIENHRAIAIYADNYNVTGNQIVSNEYGIRAKGNSNSFLGNEIRNNTVGIWIDSYGGYTGNTIAYNTIETHEQVAIEIDMGGGFTVYGNNFMINNVHHLPVSTPYLAVPGDDNVILPFWDNGVDGNFWSDYTAKYPSAAEIGNSGIGDTPYAVNVKPNITDRYPLMRQVDIRSVTLPTPSPPSTSPTPSAEPSPTLTAEPTPNSTLTPSPTASLKPTSSPSPSPTEEPTALPNQQTEFAPEHVFAVAGVGIAVAATIAFLLKRKRQ